MEQRSPDLNRHSGDRVASLIREAELALRGRASEAARLEAEMLLGHVMGWSRAGILIHSQERVTGKDRGRFRRLVGLRTRGHPLQYLTHTQEFWSLEFYVNRHTLIPRPESEILVEEGARRVTGSRPIVIDVGTGCGNLAVALARELPGARIYAVDISGEALAVAQRNARSHGVGERIRFLKGDQFAPLAGLGLEGKVDLLVANPPYISTAELAGLPVDVRDHEPRQALVAGRTGEEFYSPLIEGAGRFLKAGGSLIMELGLGRAAGVRRRLEASPAFGKILTVKDGAGIERVAIGARSSRDAG